MSEIGKKPNDKGIARAIEIEDYDPSIMNTFPELTDAQLDAIFDYIEKIKLSY